MQMITSFLLFVSLEQDIHVADASSRSQTTLNNAHVYKIIYSI